MITALTISAVAIYYSVSGLVAIFAAAAIPIIVMGTALEVGKLVTAVWLHWYWDKAKWWLKTYLSISVIVLMFITSMGIFGFLSKAHIEQTSAAEEGLAQIERIDKEVLRIQDLISRAETRIADAEASVGIGNNETQAQIDKEQTRIDTAYERIQPAIDEQNVIIQTQLDNLEDRVAVYEEEITSLDNELQRLRDVADSYRGELETTTVASIEEQVQPYNDQIAQLDEDLQRINTQANEYEQRISEVSIDNSAIEALQQQIADIENAIVVTTNKLQSTERAKIQEGQAVIGVTSDGLFGGNTRTALAKWVDAQQSRINTLQTQAIELRTQAQGTLDVERTRLTDLVKDLRGPQTETILQRKQSLLDAIDQIRSNSIDEAKETKSNIQLKIDNVLNTDIPSNRSARQTAQEQITVLRKADDPRINAARQTIKDLRAGAESQIAASNNLIQRLRDSLTVGKDTDVEVLVNAQQKKIVEFNNTIDSLTEDKYTLQAEYRKLEAEVGPIKYLAEFIYDEADKDVLEEAVRWVIIVIIFVFDPLAVLLLIASQATFEMRRQERLRLGSEGNNNDNKSNDHQYDEYAQSRDDVGRLEENTREPGTGTSTREDFDSVSYAKLYNNDRTGYDGRSVADRVLESRQEQRRLEVEHKEQTDEEFKEAKRLWKLKNPDQTAKDVKEQYILGNIDNLPWDISFIAKDAKGKQYTGYVQNNEQNQESVWQKIGSNDKD